MKNWPILMQFINNHEETSGRFHYGAKEKKRAFNNYPKAWGEVFALNKVQTNQCFIFHVANFGRNRLQPWEEK